MIVTGIIVLITLTSIRAEPNKESLKSFSGGCVLDGLSVRCRKANSIQLDVILSSINNPETLGSIPVTDLVILDTQLSVLREGWLKQLPFRNLKIGHSELTDDHILTNSLTGLEASLQSLSLEGNHLTTIPQALHNLSALRTLDLSHNNIQVLPVGSIFFNLHQLLHLNLAFNNLGYLELVQEQQSVAQRNKTLLALSLFNLEPLRESLEKIDLQSNNFTLFPEQFLRPFPRLFSLNLADNHIEDIPHEAFQHMPELAILQLAKNELKSLKILISPSQLNLQGNPLRCDCQAVWLQQWLRNMTHKTRDGLDIAKSIPLCHSPLKFKGLKLASLTNELLCSDKVTAEFRYAGDEDLHNLPGTWQDLHLTLNDNTIFSTNNAPAQRSVNLTVTPLSETHSSEWTFVYRQLGLNPIPQYIPIPSSHPRAGVAQSYLELNPNASYSICIAVKDSGIHYIHPKFCQEALPQRQPTLNERTGFKADESNSPILHVIPNINSISLQWTRRTKADCADIWFVRYRSLLHPNQPWTQASSTNCSAELKDLSSDILHEICWQISATRSLFCQQIRTLPDANTGKFMTTEVALAAGVSSSTTFTLITLVGCCCCRRKKANKAAKKTKQIPEPFVGDKAKPTRSADLLGRIPNPKESANLAHDYSRRHSVYASLRRFYHKCQIGTGKQTHPTFEATKRYLQHKTQDFAFESSLVDPIPQTIGNPKPRPSINQQSSLWTQDSTSSSYLTPNFDDSLQPRRPRAMSQTLRSRPNKYGTLVSNWHFDSREKKILASWKPTLKHSSRNKYYTWTTPHVMAVNRTLTQPKFPVTVGNFSSNKYQRSHVTVNPLYLYPQPMSNSELQF